MSNYSKQFVFRSALVRTCGDMGKETWTSFCFMYDVPDSVREQSRADVLKYLVDKSAISVHNPEDFAELIRTQLHQATLAQTFLDTLAEEASIETRGSVNRSLHSTHRRGGRHLSNFTLDDMFIPVSTSSPLLERDGGYEEGTFFGRRHGNAESSYPLSVTPTEDCDVHPRHRHDSMLSTYSDRSSGYFSQRSHSITSMYLDSVSEQLEEVRISRESSPEVCPSTASVSTSTEASVGEDDFQSCSSGSLESLHSNGSLPRGITAAGDLDISHHPEPKMSSSKPINVPTYSTITKTDSITLSLKEIRSDIEQGLKDKVYCSVSSPDRHQHGVDFLMRFYPVNHEGSGAALHVVVRSHLENRVIPPLNITVCVHELSNSSRKSVCRRKNKDCLAHEQRNSTLSFQSQYTALFRTLVDHKKFRKAAGEAVAIQVLMEYTTQHTMQ